MNNESQSDSPSTFQDKVNFIKENFFIITSFLVFAMYMTNDSFLPAINFLAYDFGIPVSMVQYGISIFTMSVVLSQIPVGMLSDTIGRKKVLILGCSTFIVATYGIEITHSVTVFLIWRVFQGIASACIIGTSVAMINEYYTHNKRVMAMSISNMLTLLSPMCGPLFGTWVLASNHNQWQSIYTYNNYIVIALLIISIIFVPETLRSIVNKRKHKDKNKINHQEQHTEQASDDMNIEDPISENNKNDDEQIEKLRGLIANKPFMLLLISVSMQFLLVMLWVTSSPDVIMNYFNKSQSFYSYSQMPVFGLMAFAIMFGGGYCTRFNSDKFLRYNAYALIINGFIFPFVLVFVNDVYTFIACFTCLLITGSFSVAERTSAAIASVRAKGLAAGINGVLAGLFITMGSLIPPFFAGSSRYLFFTFLTIFACAQGLTCLWALRHINVEESNKKADGRS